MTLLMIVLLSCILLFSLCGLNAQANGNGGCLLRSLSLRIGLSIGLFMLLLLGAAFGWWRARQT